MATNRAGLLRGYRPYQCRNGRRAPSELSYQNFPVQSGGSAVLMLTLSALPPWANVVLTMHDALLLEVPVEAVETAAAAAQHAMETGLHALFPRVRSRAEARASWRYVKEAPDSLHRFCHTLGVGLQAEVGWEAPADLLVDRGAPPPPPLCPPSPSPSSLPSLSI